MNTKDTADALVALWREGRIDEASETYWADDVSSYEAQPGEMAAVHGKDAARAKGEWWTQNHDVHGMEVQGPYVNGDQFAVVFRMDFTQKATGQRMQMEEVAVYTIRDGKIVEERFFY